MLVETYEIEEINSSAASLMAADSESLDLIEKLGLKGQKTLSDPKTATRQPYRRVTQLERNIFDVLFPARVKIEDYSSGPIPLRVLQVAALAKELGVFKHLEVWGPTDVREKDPVLIGVTGNLSNPSWTWDSWHFLLARWGDALPTIEQLGEKAMKIWLSKTRPALEAIRTKAEQDMARLDSIAVRAFVAGEPLEALEYRA